MAELSLTDLQKIASLDSDIRDYANETDSSITNIETSLGNISNKVNKIAGVFGTTLAIGTFSGIAKALWDMDKSTTKLAIRAGKGKEYAKELKTAVNGLQKNLGASFNEANQLVTSLAKKNYVGNIGDAANAAYNFADATGLSIEETAELTDNLSKIVGFSEKSTAALYYGITKIQQANGISEQGMSALANRISEASANMKAFGRSDEQIKSMSISTAKLVSVMEKVGVSAQKSLGFLDRLTDPERIEENIGLYSQLGISMEEALSGGDIADQLTDGMKEFGRKLQSMGPIAGAAYAKSFGVSYKEAIKAAKSEDINVETETTDEKSLKALQGLAEQTHSLTDKMQRGFQKVNGFIMGLGPVIMTVAAIAFMVVKKIIAKSKQATASISTEVTKNAKDSTASISTEVAKTIDKIKGKAKVTGNTTKGFIGSIFDTSSIREAENAADSAVEKFKIGLHGTIPVISMVAEGVAKEGRGIRRHFDAFFKDSDTGISALGKNATKSSVAYFKNQQDGYKKQWEDTVAETKLLEDQRKQLTKGSAEWLRMGKIIDSMKERAGQYSSMMTKATKESLQPDRDKIEAAKKEYDELYKVSEELSKQATTASTLAKTLNTQYSRDQAEKAQYEATQAEIAASAAKERLNAIQKASDALKEQYRLNEQANANNKEAMEYMAKHPFWGRVGQRIRDLGTITNSEGAEQRPETKGQAVKNILFKGVKAVIEGPFKLLGAGLKALKGAVLGAIKTLGPIGLGMMGIRVVMKLLAKPLERIREKIENKLQPIMDKLDEQLGPSFEGVADALLKLATTLLPPLLFITGLLVSAIGHVINSLKWLPGVGKQINEVGDSFVSAGKAMRGVEVSLDKNTDSNNKKTENQPGSINVAGNGGLSVDEGTVATSSSQPSASYGESVKLNADKKKKEQSEEERKKTVETMAEITKDIKEILKKSDKNQEVQNKVLMSIGASVALMNPAVAVVSATGMVSKVGSSIFGNY